MERTNNKKHKYEQFQTEFECEFLGSVDTLINASKIKTMAVVDQEEVVGFDVYEMPKKVISIL